MKINITDASHADHLDSPTLDTVLGLVSKADPTVNFGNFRIYVVTLPNGQTVASALRGPETGEEPVSEGSVFYGTRNGRPNVSRLTDLPATQDGRVTVLISRESDDAEWGLITAFGGPLAPQEPGDPYLAPEKHADSVAFWSQHALSVDGSPESSRVEGHSFALFSAPAEKTPA
jgi:hypothetical protein